MDLAFTASVVEWRGPAPFVFASLPGAAADAVAEIAALASYGWGCIPVSATIGGVGFRTSLFPRDGGYLLPLKVAVRRPLGVEVGDLLDVRLTIDLHG